MLPTDSHSLAASWAAAPIVAASPPAVRAKALTAAADALAQAADELVELAMAETGLGEVRLRGELKRTCVQLRLFADVVTEGSYLDVRLDAADPQFVLGPRPDLRRYLAPVGPVLNFAASNFPFAFSVAGGDTASALAAGNPVVVKVHPGHPELSARVAELLTAAFVDCGLPGGTLLLIFGQQEGVDALQDPRVAAGCFTGSTTAGQFLARIAADRHAPIPFFGELGSVNPVFVTAGAVAARGAEIAAGFVTSVTSSAGQLCTKPGFLLVPSGSAALVDAITAGAAAVPEHRLLHPGITTGYASRRDAILATPGVSVLVEGSVLADELAHGWATPTLVRCSMATLRAAGPALLDEAFGPLSVVVDYDDLTDLPAIVDELFPGNLTGTVHCEQTDDTQSESVGDLLDRLAATSGRVLINGWPTGVAVTPAMQHGGPWPATTATAATSVGTAAIQRFLRPVCYQNTPENLLPPPLQDANPWGVPQQRSPAGASPTWGTLG